VIDILAQLVAPTVAYIEEKIQGYAATGGLIITALSEGDVTEQILQTVSFTIEAFTGIITNLTRSGFLDTAMDPGDNPEDADPDYSAPYWLSMRGEGDYGTPRFGKTFARGFVTLTNAADGITQYIAPFSMTFTRTDANTDGSYPTYQNEADASIYIVNGTLELQPGQTAIIPIVADVVGTLSNAGAGDIVTITSTMLGVTCTNALSVGGSDGETRAQYIARCRAAASAGAPGGPLLSYSYFSNTLPGGEPLLNADGAAVDIVETYITTSSTTGKVNAYYRSSAASGGVPSADDVIAANLNITTYAVPAAVTFGPSLSPVGGIAAVAVSIPITYTAKIINFAGIDTAEIELDVKAALDDYFASVAMGGFDRTAGAGFIYTSDIRAEIKATRRERGDGARWGLYDVVVTTPAGASTAIALGRFGARDAGATTATVTPV
jgi:hypothetical protein